MKKKISLIAVLTIIVLMSTACGDKSEKTSNTNELKDDEIITTYAYPNIDGIDVSSLQEVTLDALDITNEKGISGDVYEYKMAFFGEVNNVKVNYTTYAFESLGKEIESYDHLEDTVLVIKSNELLSYSGFFVSFEDGRGTSNRFFYGDEIVATNEKVELVSGFTALEKTPSSYTAFDLSEIIACVGMTTDEFESSSLMQYADKEMQPGMDYEYYDYQLNDYINGYELNFQASEQDKIISICNIYKDQETYNSLTNEEKFSFQGIDFDMSVIRARYNLVEPDSSINVTLWGETDEDEVSTLSLYK